MRAAKSRSVSCGRPAEMRMLFWSCPPCAREQEERETFSDRGQAFIIQL